MGLFDALGRARTDRQIKGQAGEDDALAYLQARGLTPVERNFRCKGGELDLVMAESGTLVFVEVRKRADSSFGGAAASITARKQARLVIAAHVFLRRYKAPPPCRFDIIAIDGETINWLKNAIEA
jgi:putative endonuclease